MKVRIVKAEQATYWYAARLGEVVEVMAADGDPERYELTADVQYDNGFVRFIRKTDCQIVDPAPEGEPRV